MAHFKRRSMQISTVVVATAGLWPGLPAQAGLVVPTYTDSTFRSNRVEYGACVAGLLEAEVAPGVAATVCASALYPRDLSTCVTGLQTNTALAPEIAVENCRRVRRPTDLATCVVNISQFRNVDEPEVTGASLFNLVDSCRRSLLPLRFSECVIGLRGQIAVTIPAAMGDCLAATNRPRAVLPNFIPRNSQPLVPLVPAPSLAPLSPR